MSDILLELQDLAFSFHTYAGEVQAVRGVSFTLKKGEVIGIVGESGCGKSVTAKCISKMNPGKPHGEYKRGAVIFDGRDIANIPEREMRGIRARDIRMIFQDPMTSLNPTMKVGKQIAEGVMKYRKMPKAEAAKIALEALEMVGIPSASERYNQYPHQFSGGMRQRAMIALAMAVNPKLLIADEPTTALDVTTQAQILELIKKLKSNYDTSIIIITHDLGVVANIADNIAVMYAGKIMEYGTANDIFDSPAHPYTWGVLRSIPPIDADASRKLTPIQGTPPDLFNPPTGCPFAARCDYAMEVCKRNYPEEIILDGVHRVSCWLTHANAPKTVNPVTGKEVERYE